MEAPLYLHFVAIGNGLSSDQVKVGIGQEYASSYPPGDPPIGWKHTDGYHLVRVEDLATGEIRKSADWSLEAAVWHADGRRETVAAQADHRQEQTEGGREKTKERTKTMPVIDNETVAHKQRHGFLSVDDFIIEVLTTGERIMFGRKEVRVTPVSGSGAKWVQAQRLKETGTP